MIAEALEGDFGRHPSRSRGGSRTHEIDDSSDDHDNARASGYGSNHDRWRSSHRSINGWDD